MEAVREKTQVNTRIKKSLELLCKRISIYLPRPNCLGSGRLAEVLNGGATAKRKLVSWGGIVLGRHSLWCKKPAKPGVWRSNQTFVFLTACGVNTFGNTAMNAKDCRVVPKPLGIPS
jgi:hypothetical protein